MQCRKIIQFVQVESIKLSIRLDVEQSYTALGCWRWQFSSSRWQIAGTLTTRRQFFRPGFLTTQEILHEGRHQQVTVVTIIVVINHVGCNTHLPQFLMPGACRMSTYCIVAALLSLSLDLCPKQVLEFSGIIVCYSMHFLLFLLPQYHLIYNYNYCTYV